MDSTDETVLVFEGGPSHDEKIPMQGPATTLRRHSDNDVLIPGGGVSRRHAEILQSDSGYLLRDLGSTNGTFVNLEQVPERGRLLEDGDRIRLGSSDVTLLFLAPGARTLEMVLGARKTPKRLQWPSPRGSPWPPRAPMCLP